MSSLYTRDSDFMSMVSGMPVKPSRMDDAWMMLQLANFCNGLSGDFLLVDPELWSATIIGRVAQRVGKTVHAVCSFSDDLHGTKEEFNELVKGFSDLKLHSMDSAGNVGRDWCMVYLNSNEWLDSNVMYERIVYRGCVLASGGCRPVLQGWPQVLTINMPSGQSVYLMR